jgi:thioesterase domain-containing protein
VNFRPIDYDELSRSRLPDLPLPMPDVTAKPSPAPLASELLALQSMIDREIPMCAQMGISVHGGGPDGLVMRLPLGPNRNHQQTAFAGSLNALCTIAGWGTVFLLLRELNRCGNVVIRRGAIRYQEPVTTPEILARCQPITADARQYFLEMLDDKRQAKIDLTVEIPGPTGPLVSFNGSYVVMQDGATG